jgi:hypothetical protein
MGGVVARFDVDTSFSVFSVSTLFIASHRDHF